MRRTVATVLITAVLASASPSFAARRDDDPWNAIKIIKKIIRVLLPVPSDDSNNLGPPKP